MDHNNDRLWIIVTDDFTWHPVDASNCFKGKLPAPDLELEDPYDAYGPFTASKAGTVTFWDAEPSAGKKLSKKKPVVTPHSIIVS
jgi:hypothetical protein